MFGYVIPDKDNMLIKDFNVFQAFYCGLCKALHETGSEVTRFCTNYDVTFYSVLMHEITKTPVTFERKLCVYNGRKKVVVEPDELSKKMADLAVLLVYYNIRDDVADGKKLRAPLAWRLYLRKRKAAKNMPKIDALMRERFGLLARLEKEKCDSIDRVADTFASLMRDITRELIREDEEERLARFTESKVQLVESTKAKQTAEGCEDEESKLSKFAESNEQIVESIKAKQIVEDCEDEERKLARYTESNEQLVESTKAKQTAEGCEEGTKSLTEDEKRDIDDFCYNLGRLVYLADAVDDVEKDSKKGTYNVLLLNFGECAKKADYLVKNADELSFLLKSTYNKMVGAYNRMNVSMYEGVLSNTVYLGIEMQIERLLKGDEKCQITRL